MKTITSMKIAGLLGVTNDEIFNSIKNVYIPAIIKAKKEVGDFFILKNGAVYGGVPYYEATKQGCDLIGEGIDGERGVQFTVEYARFFENDGDAKALINADVLEKEKSKIVYGARVSVENANKWKAFSKVIKTAQQEVLEQAMNQYIAKYPMTDNQKLLFQSLIEILNEMED